MHKKFQAFHKWPWLEHKNAHLGQIHFLSSIALSLILAITAYLPCTYLSYNITCYISVTGLNVHIRIIYVLLWAKMAIIFTVEVTLYYGVNFPGCNYIIQRRKIKWILVLQSKQGTWVPNINVKWHKTNTLWTSRILDLQWKCWQLLQLNSTQSLIFFEGKICTLLGL